jgi:hypothetical protein
MKIDPSRPAVAIQSGTRISTASMIVLRCPAPYVIASTPFFKSQRCSLLSKHADTHASCLSKYQMWIYAFLALIFFFSWKLPDVSSMNV